MIIYRFAGRRFLLVIFHIHAGKETGQGQCCGDYPYARNNSGDENRR